MADLIHILGSPITHHNTTVFSFFQEHITKLTHKTLPIKFMVAVDTLDPKQSERYRLDYPDLSIECYEGKKQLALALIEHAKTHKTCRYFLHGQFNPKIWFSLILNQLDGSRFAWHIWGADLYEEETSLKYKFFYFIRRFAQQRIEWFFATKGDAEVLAKRITHSKIKRLYFPTKMNYDLTPSLDVKRHRLERLQSQERELTILLGNSGDKTNHHLLGLDLIYKTFGQNVRIIIPMGYPENNQTYIAEVEQKANHLFNIGSVDILKVRLPFEDYLKCLSKCDLAYFLFERQQGIGTISLCIQQCVPFVLHSENAFHVDLSYENIPYFLTTSQMDIDSLVELQTNLNQVEIEKIGFLSPNYMSDWAQALSNLTGEEHVIT
ncbi:TDP-N-acetylfucosamine:lipid II N-acetylfucosaminyltransferase [Thorsellia anophelis]|uniref:dTDP-N-acetylfucosamine:lipid II N-acetylfucosaminyltransferase n=1 Tax=Thorsellia anophelis DSM 18579 TaxID=1123402 RepID=A0A1H9YRC3_9GAMM|nr:TDP-N-acetylfucosamine:lipid II N-acetylfucosaminyltransferase [Thorsellia anophelis]SES71678.1 dTDP-N-acetylfucosamine:lipid II N-acetylfucosaminyltransferase [Thorsellia anophelis DSM 18579]